MNMTKTRTSKSTRFFCRTLLMIIASYATDSLMAQQSRADCLTACNTTASYCSSSNTQSYNNCEAYASQVVGQCLNEADSNYTQCIDSDPDGEICSLNYDDDRAYCANLSYMSDMGCQYTFDETKATCQSNYNSCTAACPAS